jgi:hypothetical protein
VSEAGLAHAQAPLQTLKDFQIRPNPEQNNEKYTRAIYFHPDEAAPRFVWLKTERKRSDEDEVQYQVEYLITRPGALIANSKKEANSNDHIFARNASIKHNYALGRELPHNIFVRHRDTFLVDGSKQNKAIHKVMDLRSRYLHDWRGPIIAYGTELFEDFRLDPLYSHDLTPSDLRPIEHWLNSYKCQGNSIEEIKRELGTVVGVRMNCLGDEKTDGRPKCEPASIPAYHWVFDEDVAPISERLGFPIMALRIPGSFEHWEKRPAINGIMAYCNPSATFLHLGCDPKVKDGMLEGRSPWGWAPWKWQNVVGSIIVARKDKKPLLPEHADALAEFCQVHLNHLFQKQTERNWKPKHVLKEIRKDKFLKYYNTWKALQIDEEKRTQISLHMMSRSLYTDDAHKIAVSPSSCPEPVEYG